MATLKIPCSSNGTQAVIKLNLSIFWSEMEVLKELNLFKKALKQISVSLEIALLHKTK